MPTDRTFLVLTYESQYSWVNEYKCDCDDETDELCRQCQMECDSYTNKTLVVSSDCSVLESVIAKELETLLKSNDPFFTKTVRELYYDEDGDDYGGHGDDDVVLPSPHAKTNALIDLRRTYNFLKGHKWETKSTAFEMLTATKGTKENYMQHTFTLKLKTINEPLFKEELIARTLAL